MKQIKPKKGLEALHAGDFNYMSVRNLPDGTRLYRLYKRSTKKTFMFRVKDLNKPTEKLIKGDIEWPQIQA